MKKVRLKVKMRYFFISSLMLLIAACSINDDEMSFSLDVENLALTRFALKKIVSQEKIFLDSIFKNQWINGKRIKVNEAGEYFLAIENKLGIPVYIEPGFNLKVVISRTNRFSYKGKGSDENEYLNRNKYHPVNKYRNQLHKLKPDLFIQELTKCFDPLFAIIDDHNVEKEFWKRAYADQRLKKLTSLLNYPKEYRRLNGSEVKLSEDYWTHLKQYDLNSPDLYVGNNDVLDEFFTSYVEYLYSQYNKGKHESISKKILTCFQLIYHHFSNEHVRTEVMKWYALSIVTQFSDEETKAGLRYFKESIKSSNSK